MNQRIDLDCATVDELAAAYALGAVEPAEERALSEHLPECDSPHAEARRLIDAAAAVPAGLEPVAPSAALRERLMATVTATPQERSVAETAGGRVIDLSTRRRWWQAGPLPAALAAAALVAAVGFGAWGVSVSSELAERDAAIRAIAAADDIHRATGTVGEGWVIESGDEAMFMAEDLADLPDGQLYEFWVIDAEGNATAAGILTDASGVTLVPLERGLEGATTFVVTIETERVELPTNDPVMVAALDP